MSSPYFLSLSFSFYFTSPQTKVPFDFEFSTSPFLQLTRSLKSEMTVFSKCLAAKIDHTAKSTSSLIIFLFLRGNKLSSGSLQKIAGEKYSGTVRTPELSRTLPQKFST